VTALLVSCAVRSPTVENRDFAAQQTLKDISAQSAELLIKSIEKKDVAAVKRLLESGVSPNVKDSVNYTALKLAILKGNREIVKLLLDAGAGVNTVDDSGKSVLMDAVGCRDNNMVSLLLDAGADMGIKEQQFGETALHMAAQSADVALLKQLIERAQDVNVRDAGGTTPLIMVAGERVMRTSEDNIEVIRALLEKGADVNAKNDSGGTPLTNAIGDLKVMKLLIENGADVNVKTRNGWTPLESALLEGCPDAIKLLKKCGAKE
jgi:ankyrin repeat protein